ncbi:hypothetical protein ScPMuIL_004853 [Solemya velum]
MKTVATLENNHFRIIRQGIYDLDTFKPKVHDKFLVHLCQNIRDRFPDMGVITAFSCLDPSTMRNLATHDLEEFDDDKIETLCEHYDGEIDPMATRQEFSSFNAYLHKSKEKKFVTVLSSTHQHCGLVPERGFSAKKRVKTDLRTDSPRRF